MTHFLLLIMTGIVQAATCPEVPEAISFSEKCNPTVKAELNRECRTSSGGQFRRKDKGWQDTAKDGLLWNDEVRTHVDYNGAKKFCEDKGLRLPTAEEFRVAEQRGFRDALDRMSFFYYWSGTDIPSKNLAYGFGTNARLLATLPQNSGTNAYYVAARCVSGEK